MQEKTCLHFLRYLLHTATSQQEKAKKKWQRILILICRHQHASIISGNRADSRRKPALLTDAVLNPGNTSTRSGKCNDCHRERGNDYMDQQQRCALCLKNSNIWDFPILACTYALHCYRCWGTRFYLGREAIMHSANGSNEKYCWWYFSMEDRLSTSQLWW